jgi:hypothetical protein
MLIERKQLKNIFIKLIIETLGFDDETEEVIRWNDPKRKEKIRDYNSQDRDDYVIQSLDNLDPFSMAHKERIAYIEAMAEKMTREFEARQKKRKAEKEEKESAKLDAYIEMLKQGGSDDSTMPVSRIYDDTLTL